jgi:hypothetical protein
VTLMTSSPSTVSPPPPLLPVMSSGIVAV